MNSANRDSRIQGILRSYHLLLLADTAGVREVLPQGTCKVSLRILAYLLFLLAYEYEARLHAQFMNCDKGGLNHR